LADDVVARAERDVEAVEVGGAQPGLLGAVHDADGRVGGGEEAEFCLRVRAARPGGEFWFVPEARIDHRVPAPRATWSYLVRRSYDEGVMKGDIARALGRDALDVRLANLYGLHERNVTHYQMTAEDNILHDLLPQLEQSALYRQRQEAVSAWNAANPVLKRGLGLTPVKFGISFTATLFNQAG
ncbi:MAG: hypothetical protein ACLGIW_22505, partial [Gammaproteobacteria bacterium]